MPLRKPPLHWGSTRPRAGGGQGQPGPHFAVSNPFLVVSPPRWLACHTGWELEPRGSPLPSRVKLLLSPLPTQLPVPRASRLALLGHCLYRATLSYSSGPEAKPGPLSCCLPGAALPCSPVSLLLHSHTAPCTQHHVSKQLTLSRELGGREPGGGKVGRSRKSSLGSGAEALPSPATRGLQAPRRVCAGGPWSSFPSSRDQIPKNERLGPGPGMQARPRSQRAEA